MRVFVELPQSIDVASWGEKHAAGQAADETPYGLHRLERHGHVVRFSRWVLPRPLRRVARILSNRLWEMQVANGLLGGLDPLRRDADVVLCMDERNGIPAALVPSRVPVVTGVAWLENPAELPAGYRAVAAAALKRAAAVFVECSAMLEPLELDFRVPRRRLHFVTLGIDETHFVPADAPPVSGLVFSVGDDRMRDYATLTAALNLVSRQYPSMAAEIATTLPVEFPEWATVHRRRMDDAVRDCYHRASVVALALKPTRQGSGLTVILEAMASGRPVIVTDNPGLSDYVRHGETGLLVPPSDPAAMAQAVTDLLRDPERAEAMGRAGRRYVEDHCTSQHMAADLDRVLRSL